MANKIYNLDEGTEFIFDCGVSITDAITTLVKVTLPDDTEVIWNAVKHIINGKENYLKYVSLAGDLDLIGVYIAITSFTFSTRSGKGDPTIFTVWDGTVSGVIKIHNKYLEEIKDLTAFPIVDNILLSDNQIRDLCIRPAFRDYFTKFPIELPESQSINGTEIVIDFPDVFTYGVTDIRIVGNPDSADGSNFFDIYKYQIMGGAGGSGSVGGAYGIKGYNPNSLLQERLSTMQANQSMKNRLTTVKYRVDPNTKKVHAYTNTSGKLNITWAKYSNDFESIGYTKINDVLKLCKANLLEHLGMSSSMIDDGSEINVNSDILIDTAKEMREQVFEKWNEFPDIIVLHAK